MKTAWKIAGGCPVKAPITLRKPEIYPGAVEVGAEWFKRGRR